MRRYSIVALLLGLLVVAAPFTRNTAFAADDEDDDEENDVVDITSKNFDSIVKGSKYALVSGPRKTGPQDVDPDPPTACN